MLAHPNDFAPLMIKTIDTEQTRKLIQLGMFHAAKYGFTFRGSVRLNLELMLLLGSYFDTNPEYPWAAEILNDRQSGSQVVGLEAYLL